VPRIGNFLQAAPHQPRQPADFDYRWELGPYTCYSERPIQPDEDGLTRFGAISFQSQLQLVFVVIYDAIKTKSKSRAYFKAAPAVVAQIAFCEASCKIWIWLWSTHSSKRARTNLVRIPASDISKWIGCRNEQQTRDKIAQLMASADIDTDDDLHVEGTSKRAVIESKIAIATVKSAPSKQATPKRKANNKSTGKRKGKGVGRAKSGRGKGKGKGKRGTIKGKPKVSLQEDDDSEPESDAAEPESSSLIQPARSLRRKPSAPSRVRAAAALNERKDVYSFPADKENKLPKDQVPTLVCLCSCFTTVQAVALKSVSIASPQQRSLVCTL